MDFTQALPTLTRRERAVAIAVALVCAASRFAAMARTLWDWDETLFCLGMRAYDVASHHPHPPGFPVYIAFGHIARAFIGDDFRALQAVNLFFGMLLFPAMFLLARELRLRYETALIAAALCSFFPNVWFFGGTAFSDIPSLTLVVFAVALLFRGCRSANAYIAGAFLLALAAGIRPQNFVIGLYPGILATWYRVRVSWRDVVFAALIGTTIVVVAFGGALWATGGAGPYLNAVKVHGEYISKVDSFRSPERPPLWRLFDRFFIKQYQSPPLSVITSVFVLVSTIGAIRARDRRIGAIALTFGPFAIMAFLMLDRFSISRFSIGYCPLFAILAADGIARAVKQETRRELILGTALIVTFIVWTLPALTPVRNELSPPVQVIEAAKRQIVNGRDELFVGFAMTPFVEYLMPYRPFFRVLDERAMPLSSNPQRHPWLLTELDHTPPRGLHYHRERDRLWYIARRHYFDVALEPMNGLLPQFVSGWYGAERSGSDEWRWMSGHSITRLPPLASADAVLRFYADVPNEVIAQHATITVTLNGKVVERFVATEEHPNRQYDVKPAPNGAPNMLELDVDRTVNYARQHLGDDPRELGMLVKFLSWGPG